MSLLFCNVIEQLEILKLFKFYPKPSYCVEKLGKKNAQSPVSEVVLMETEQDSEQCTWKLVYFECPENVNSKCSGSLNVLL